MLIKLQGRLFAVNYGKGKAYCTFNDVEQSGLFELTIPGAKDLKLDGLYTIEAVVQPGQYNGRKFLTVVELISANTEKGDK